MPSRQPPDAREPQRVALFVTCLVDLFRPAVGFAAVRLLEQAGYTVDVPAQGCCGQPNFNSGDRPGAAKVARQWIRSFADFDYVVVPSGSCAAMIRRHYTSLFPVESELRAAAAELAGKTYELTAFLHDVAGMSGVGKIQPTLATYHDGCSGLRELGIRRQPRKLLRSIAGLDIREMSDADACCGFGGMFCVKYPDISNRIADAKLKDISATGAACVITGETGCLLQIQGKLHRDGSDIAVAHVAEVLAEAFDPGESATEKKRAND